MGPPGGWQVVKKAITIFAAVTGYCLFEIAFLLSCDLQPYELSAFRNVVLLGQFLLIPGCAVLFSRILYGAQGWGWRALTILSVGALGPFILIALLVAAGFGAEWVASISESPMIATALPIAIAVLLMAGIAMGVFLFARRKARRGIELEAARWLAERQPGADPGERRWRNRGIRWASWIPSLTVAVVFLFLPETWGISTHLSQPWAGKLAGYRVSAPLTWITLNHGTGPAEGQSWVRGMVGDGVAFGVKPYLHYYSAPFFAWSVSTGPYTSWKQPESRYGQMKDEITGRHVIAINNESLTCLEYTPAGQDRDHEPLVLIRCNGSSRLRSGMLGPGRYAPAFYRMLQGITSIQ
ncbi:MAG: hypothetical protein LAP21_24260 [Acidobacteriia bacterium]|nr:hypothetical protein [Terriglobia bacterium]